MVASTSRAHDQEIRILRDGFGPRLVQGPLPELCDEHLVPYGRGSCRSADEVMAFLRSDEMAVSESLCERGPARAKELELKMMSNRMLLHYVEVLDGVQNRLEVCVIVAEAVMGAYERADALLVAARARGKLSVDGTLSRFGYTMQPGEARHRRIQVTCLTFGNSYAVSFVAPSLTVRVSVHDASVAYPHLGDVHRLDEALTHGVPVGPRDHPPPTPHPVLLDIWMDQAGLANLVSLGSRTRRDLVRILRELKSVSCLATSDMRLACWGMGCPGTRQAVCDLIGRAGLRCAA